VLARLRKAGGEKDQGFTLIELLVVMIIIGILAAIAIPIFLNQRKKAVDTSVRVDVKNVANAIEEWAVENPNLAVDPTASWTTAKLTAGTTITVIAGAALGTYCIKGQNVASNATGTSFIWYSSDAGGLKNKASTTSPGGACG
jgi:type IV pilus assembly protein PilA